MSSHVRILYYYSLYDLRRENGLFINAIIRHINIKNYINEQNRKEPFPTNFKLETYSEFNKKYFKAPRYIAYKS